MTVDERLALIRVKIERAKKHVGDLQAEVSAFLGSNPYEISTKRDPDTRASLHYVARVREPPVILAAIAGDVLQNLRSALDYLAYQLVLVGSPGQIPTPHIYFPICESAAKYKTESPGKVQGMRQDAVDAINALEPYKGGKDRTNSLWRLHRLNIIDKHRMLVTVGLAYVGVDIPPQLRQSLVEQFPHYRDVTMFSISADYGPFPLKDGYVLWGGLPDAEMDENMQFHFDIAFGEPQVVHHQSLIKTLQHMSDLVDYIICSFRPLLV